MPAIADGPNGPMMFDGQNWVPYKGPDPAVTSGGGAATVLASQPPITAAGEDKALASGLAQGGEQLVTAVPSAADLALAGASGVSKLIAGDDNKVGGALDTVRSEMYPATYQGVSNEIAQKAPWTSYQPKNKAEQWTQSLAQWAPSVVGGAGLSSLVGGVEKAAPALLQGTTAALGSEAAGQQTQGTPLEPWARTAGALMGGALPRVARGGITPFPVASTDPARLAYAKALQAGGVPVSAADMTGSRVMSTLEGGAPNTQSQAISDALMSKGGLAQAQVQNPTLKFGELLDKRQADLQTRRNTLAQNTTYQDDPQFGTQAQLLKMVHDYNTNSAPSKVGANNNPVQTAWDDYVGSVNKGKMSGAKYMSLSQDWKNDPSPVVNRMGQVLDAGMERGLVGTPYEGAFSQYNTDYANYSGLRAAQEKGGDLRNIDPSAVVKGMYKDTPMRDFATAANEITGNRPNPYNWAERGGVLGLTGTLGAAGGAALAGGLHGNTAEALDAGILGGMMGPSATMASELIGRGVGNSKPVQAWAKNQLWQPGAYTTMNPQVAAALLATKGPSSLQQMIPEPGSGQQ